MMLLAETCAHAGCISSANLKYYGETDFHQSERRFRRTDLANDTCLWEPKLLLRVGNRAAGSCVASSPDSDLEAFSHNPAHGSFAPLAFQPSAMTNCANQRFLSY
ncbi:unnamed protein product [Brassica rapa subsp. narinosa]